MSLVELYLKVLSNGKDARKGTEEHPRNHDYQSNFQEMTQVIREDIEANEEVLGSLAKPIGDE